MPKILIYVPLIPTRPRLYPRTWNSLKDLAWDEPLDIVLGRNDGQIRPSQRFRHYRDLTMKYNRARDIVVNCGYDALFTVEADMVIPQAALERLSRVEADVVYGLYVSRHGDHKWLAYDRLTENTGRSFSATPDKCLDAWGSVVETVGVGLGCTYIHRNVLERIEFKNSDAPLIANDWLFAMDCQALGFTQMHDCGVVCGHIMSDDSQRILWPEPDGRYSEEYRTKEKIPIVRDGETMTVEIGSFGSYAIYPETVIRES